MMKFSSISDLHMESQNDKASQIFEQFIMSKEVQNSDMIFLLGDIFDFMVGNHSAYLKRHAHFFEIVACLIHEQNKIVYYVEGNHDFHLEKLMDQFRRKFKIQQSQFIHSKEAFSMKLGEKIFYFTHGHEVDENKSYQKWKSIYSSKPFHFFVDHLLPYHLIEKLGVSASQNSKKRNKKSFILDQSKEKYRQGARNFLNDNSVDFLIAGHTHIAESLTHGNKLYVNNGFPLITKQFIHFDGENLELKKLN